MAIIQGHAMQSSSRGFYPKTLNGSLRFNSGDAPYLSYTNTTATNGKKCTLSFWIKKNEIIGSTTTARFIQAYSGVGNQFHSQWGDGATSPGDQWQISPGEQSSQQGMRMTDASLRDPSAWYHCVWKYNSESGSEESTLYVNGVQQTSSSYTTAPTTNLVTSLTKSGTEVKIGYINSSMPDFQLAELFILDGQSLGADSFGETKNGVWVPKNVTATDFTMGNNGVHLPMTDDTEVEAFNTVLYRGNATANTSITGTGFSPDLVWIKNRDSIQHHNLFDTVRGPQQLLYSNLTNAEATSTTHLNSFDSDGFTVGSATSANGSGNGIVAWCWDAGANNTITGHSSVTYTGNGGTQTISGFPFSPDLVWIKGRSFVSGHQLYDTVRGATKRIQTHTTGAEDTQTTGLTSFDKNGFNLSSLSTSNTNGADFVAWGWDAGDSDPVSNTTGDTPATVKTNGDFSIMAYSGTGAATSIGHGLSSAPNFVIVKDRSAAQNWVVWTDDINTDGNQYLELNQTSAIQSSSVFWNSTAPDASKIYLGTSNSVSGRNFICYAWRNVTGKQKFGSYTGGTNGQKITTGFRPGFLLIKRTSSSGDSWAMFDSTRSPFNDGSTEYVFANSSAVEASAASRGVNFVSDGFELVGTDGFINQSGTYIYAAFAGSYSDYITDVNTDGTVDSRVKASQTYGFSICSFNSGASGTRSFGHGLGTTPSLCIFKERNSGGAGDHWVVWEGMTGNPATSYGYLNLTNAFGTDTSQWSNTAPTSTEFTFNSGYAWSTDQDMIAYCWAEKTGYSKFGSYTGNGSTTGPTVTCGFKPAMVIMKRTDAAEIWVTLDNTRDTDGTLNTHLYPNLSSAEGTGTTRQITISDTGFQVAGTDTSINASGGTYIYAAFADTREAAFWLDQSGNDNDWQPVNLDHNDTLLDSPTDNYATWNPIGIQYGGTFTGTFSEGNLKAATSGNASHFFGTMALPSTGKFYWEVKVVSLDTNRTYVGVVAPAINTGHPASNSSSYAFIHKALWSNTGYAMTGTQTDGTASGQYSSYTAGDVLMFAVDMDTGKFFIGKNGTWQNSASPTAGTGQIVTLDLNQTWLPYAGFNSTWEVNFGQLPFKYTPPA